MKTIELNNNAALVAALVVAGTGSILPSFFNLAGYMSGMVYVIVAVVLIVSFKRKMYIRINTVSDKLLCDDDKTCVRPIGNKEKIEQLQKLNRFN